jgi:hypothetical protein
MMTTSRSTGLLAHNWLVGVLPFNGRYLNAVPHASSQPGLCRTEVIRHYRGFCKDLQGFSPTVTEVVTSLKRVRLWTARGGPPCLKRTYASDL